MNKDNNNNMKIMKLWLKTGFSGEANPKLGGGGGLAQHKEGQIFPIFIQWASGNWATHDAMCKLTWNATLDE